LGNHQEEKGGIKQHIMFNNKEEIPEVI